MGGCRWILVRMVLLCKSLAICGYIFGHYKRRLDAIFPGDVVVTALDTGVSLEWLSTGKAKCVIVMMVNKCFND